MIFGLKILFQIILALTAFLITFLDYYKSDKRTKKFKRLRQYLIIFISLSLLGNIGLVANEEVNKQRDSFAKQKEADDLKIQNEQLNNQIVELKSQNESTKEFLTGGDSFCYLELANIEPNKAEMVIANIGTHPIYDVTIRIVDLNKYEKTFNKSNQPSLKALKQSQEIIPVGNLPVSRTTMPLSRRLPSDNLRYNIFISARNGQFLQTLRLRKINGRWVEAMKVEQKNYLDVNQNISSKLLLEKADDDFPKDFNGNIDWK